MHNFQKNNSIFSFLTYAIKTQVNISLQKIVLLDKSTYYILNVNPYDFTILPL